MRDIITAVIRASDPDVMIREPETIEMACAKMIDMVTRLEGEKPATPGRHYKNRTSWEIQKFERPTANRVKILTGAGWLAAWDENGDRCEEANEAGLKVRGDIQKDKEGRKKIVNVEVVA
jgi:hypothetical protein